ncbi:hypothetical protein OG894_44680 (plasmid) [Streptomyces sp. NBC_01724]|uniref:hypothetical protein n=1 Tax=Streptomyces sp. NBC_01724 TaxID=2975922 RepID=UPI002E3631AB|nr:hypothetical protein [Streptomyces sp. NBC_01724]
MKLILALLLAAVTALHVLTPTVVGAVLVDVVLVAAIIWGLRAGMVICAGPPGDEMPPLQQVVNVSKIEQQRLTEWSTPPGWDTTDNTVDPPGRGNFLIKVGSRPGITVHVDLTQA